jgi:pimeloyl-ACP methyl ester carboxylesterase
MSRVTHRVIETNGIHMHLAEQGEGPLVILCHGFPESWYSWRHQLQALAGGFVTLANFIGLYYLPREGTTVRFQ